MKIALYVPSWPSGFSANGIVTYASYLVPALRALGHEVFVLTAQIMAGADDPHVVDLRRFAPPSTFWQRATARLVSDAAAYRTMTTSIIGAVKELRRRYQVDVLEMEESFGWNFEISRLNLLPVIVRLHGPWFLNGSFNHPNYNPALNARRERREGKAIHRANYITAPTFHVLAATEERYQRRLSASRVIANPIEPAAASGTWDVNRCSRHTLLFVGRFDEHKGGDLALRAFAEIGADQQDAKFLFVGPNKGIRGANGDAIPYEHFITGNIPESFHSRIEFRGALSHPEVMSVRTKCYATIFSSRYEVAGYAVLEAMSLGCPLVASAVGGVPEVIQHRRNGLLTPSEDVTAIAAACRDLLNDPGLAARLGRQAWLDCRELHDPQIVAKQTLAVYQEAIDAFKQRSLSSPRR
jgi:glycosyltransferase involved in cell wall biosynthesis